MKNRRNSAVLGLLLLVLVAGFLVVPTGAKAQTLSVDEINNQINALLKQLVVLLTAQLQDLQQQLAVKLGQAPAATGGTAATSTAAATSTVAQNVPPQVNITYPYGGLELTAPASTDLTASALDADGNIGKVEFFAGNTSLGTHTGAVGPWSVRWNNIPAGTHTLTAKATDDKGAVTTSGPVDLKVKSLSENTAGFQDVPPTITIVAAFTGTTLAATATVATYAGSITQVVWARAASTTSNAAYVTDTTSPYNGNAVGLAIGTHTISATVTNSQGSTATTASTTVTTN